MVMSHNKRKLDEQRPRYAGDKVNVIMLQEISQGRYKTFPTTESLKNTVLSDIYIYKSRKVGRRFPHFPKEKFFYLEPSFI